jgi:quinol monooxygenase YgiN
MAKKRKKSNNRRQKARVKFVRDMKQKILDKLAQLAEGKTPPEKVQAHVEYYESCNNAEKLVLFEIFKNEAETESIEIAKYFAEKQNGKRY